MSGFISRIWGSGSSNGSSSSGSGSPRAARAAFCASELPSMVRDFADFTVDCAYTGAPPAPPPAPPPPDAGSGNGSGASSPPPLPLRLPAPERLVAIGDLHGDYDKAARAFRLAGLTDAEGRWTGGDAVCVQVGDIFDRGDAELPLLYMLERLQADAAAAGGALHVLNGNHETMNVAGNYRYATAGADAEMARWAAWQLLGDRLRLKCGCASVFGDAASAAAAAAAVAAVFAPAEGGGAAAPASSGGGGGGGEPGSSRPAAQYNPLRRAALRPGGPIATRFLAHHPTVLQVGGTVFVHGGVLPAHVEYGLERINRETQAWLLGGGGGSGSGGGGGSGGGSGGSSSGQQANSSSSGSRWWPWPSRTGSSSDSSGNSGSSSGGKKASPAAGTPAAKPPPVPQAPAFLRGGKAIVWARDYSARDEARCDCDALRGVLGALPGAKRMVVGHTIQDGGITSACGGAALRVDVGMSAGCGGGEPEALEVLADGRGGVRRLVEGGALPEPLGPGAAPGAPHAPHTLHGPPVDTPVAAWAEALAWLRAALAGGSDSGAGAAAAPSPPPPPPPRQEPTPA